MKSKLTITLDDKVYLDLRELFKDDEQAIEQFAARAINNELERFRRERSSANQNSEGLEDYLKSGNTGSRDYGIKGQGW